MQRGCAILSYVACPAIRYFCTLPYINGKGFEKEVSDLKKCVLIFPKTFIRNTFFFWVELSKIWSNIYIGLHVKVKLKCTLVEALRLCTGRTEESRGIALLFLYHCTRREWGVSVTPRPLFTPGKDPVPIVQEAGWVPGPVWTGAENLAPTRIRSPDHPARSQSLYRLRYPAHNDLHVRYPLFLSDFNWTWIFLDIFSKNIPTINENLSNWSPFVPCGRTDGQKGRQTWQSQ